MKTVQSTVLKCRTRDLLILLACFVLPLVFAGCVSTPAAPEPTAPTAAAEAPTPLSYGAITATVKKGVTTQADLVAVFGGPNIATLDSDGTETWVYEKTASETSTTSQDTVSTQAQRLDVFFGLGLTGKATVASQSSGRTTVAHSIKTLTVIVKFNQDKTVKDFSARASHF